MGRVHHTLTFVLGALLLAVAANAAITSNNASTPGDGAWTNQATPSFSFQAISNASNTFSCELLIDGTGYGTNATVINDTPTTITANATIPEGALTWSVNCDDGAALATSSRTLNSDRTLPTSTMDTSSQNTSDNTPQIQFTLTDESDDPLTYTIYVDGSDRGDGDGSAANNTQESVTLGALAEGDHTIIVEATDEAGNAQNSSAITITVDTTAPTATIDTASQNTSDNTPQIQFTLTDAIDATLDYTIYVDNAATGDGDGTAANNTQESVTLGALAEGDHTIIVEATDEAGNAQNSSAITITVDTTAPSVTLNSPADAASLGSLSVTFNFTITDGVDDAIDYTLYLDGSPNGTGNASNGTPVTLTRTVSTGTHTWYVVGTDETSNTDTATTRSFNASDLVAPNNPAVTAADTDTDGNIELSWADVPDETTYYVYRSTGAFTNASGMTALTSLSAGQTSYEDTTTTSGTTYHYAVTAEDAAGNENTTVTSDSAAANDANTPALPATITATTAADGSVTVTWSAVSLDSTGEAERSVRYVLYRTTNLSSLDPTDLAGQLANTTSTSYTDTTMTTGTDYTYVVTTLDAADNHNTAKTANTTITPAACTTSYSYGSWDTCSGGEQSRSGSRTCYGGGDTTNTQTQSCSSGTSGGGPARAAAPTPHIAQHRWLVLSPGESVTWTPGKSGISLTSVVFSVAQGTGQANMRVERVDNPQHTTERPVHQYLDISAENIDLENATIRFTAPTAWVEEQQGEVALLHYVDGWQELPTKHLGSERGEEEYEAVTESFSLFAISTASPAATTTPEPVAEEPDAAPEQAPAEDSATEPESADKTEETPEGSAGGALIGLIVLAGLIGAGFFAWKRWRPTRS